MIASTAAAGFFAPLNSTMLAVALPRIRDEFGVGVGPLTLLVSVYLVAVAVCQPVSGKLGDAFGHRRVILVGLVVLFASSLAAAAAWAFWVLMLSRVFQGVAAALIAPNCIAYLRSHIDSQVLGRSLGFNGAAISSGAALGPVLGGLIVALAGWRLMFLINVPAAIIAGFLIFTLPRDLIRRPFAGVDLPSLVALVAAFSGLVILGNAGRIESPALVSIAVLILPVSVAAYLLMYRRRGHGVVELRLFSSHDYAIGAFSTALGNFVMYTALIAMPIYLDELRGVEEAGIGLILFSLSIASVALSPVAGTFTDRKGYRWPLVVGALVLAGASMGLAAIAGHFAAWTVAVPLTAIGVGMAFGSAGSQVASLRAWGAEIAGSASGTQSMMRYVGSVAGAAIMAAVLGAHPGIAEMRTLLWIIAIVALANLVLALGAFRRGPSAAKLPAPATA